MEQALSADGQDIDVEAGGLQQIQRVGDGARLASEKSGHPEAHAMSVFPLAPRFSLLPSGAAAESDPAVPFSLRWTIEPIEGEATDDRVRFSLTGGHGDGHFVHCDSVSLEMLLGLTREQLAARESVHVRFRLQREAGAFACEGTVSRRRGSGSCSVEADAGFVAELGRLGIVSASDDDLLRVAAARIGRDFIADDGTEPES
jgi:hypothetical protein